MYQHTCTTFIEAISDAVSHKYYLLSPVHQRMRARPLLLDRFIHLCSLQHCIRMKTSSIQPTGHMAFSAECRNGMLAIYGTSGRHFVLFRIPAVASLVQSVVFGFSDSDITMTIRVRDAWLACLLYHPVSTR